MTPLCRAVLNYAVHGDGVVRGTGVEVEVRDGRGADLQGWRSCGFELVNQPSAVEDWTDDDEIAGVHYAECEDLARRLTSCDHALVADHVKRTADQSKREREQSPVRLVHSDFAANYEAVARTAYSEVRNRGAAALGRAGISGEVVESARRVVMLQLWRNLGEAKMDFPVAFCDARTVTPAEGQPFHYGGYVAGGRSFDALAIVAPTASSAHRWYTFPEMTPDEVVAFRTYDTDLVRDGKTWFTPHSAFRDPVVEVGKPARFSIELRVMCLYL